MPKKKKKTDQKMSTIILIIVFVIIVAFVVYYTFTIKHETNINDQSLENYNIPMSNIEPEDFACPNQGYINCIPPIMPTDEYCKSPYREWIEENCYNIIFLD